MRLIKNIKKQFLALAVLGMIVISLSGCTCLLYTSDAADDR